MMKMTLVTLAVAMALLAFGASEASAWVCRAGGIGGTTLGGSWNVIDAKLIALRKCERRSPIPPLAVGAARRYQPVLPLVADGIDHWCIFQSRRLSYR